MANKVLYCQYILSADGTGATGLTVTVDVDRITRTDLTRTVVVTGGAATELRNGEYAYTVSSVDESLYDYIATFKTAATTVTQKWVGSLRSDQVDQASLVTAVWAAATRTLSSFGTLVADVWSATARTLTQSAASVTATVSGSAITVTRGDTWVISLTGLGDISTRSKLYFTAKDSASADDSTSLIQVEETAGLLYANGATATASDGTLVVNDAATGAITITIKPNATKNAIPRSSDYDVQMVTAAGVVTTLTDGAITVESDITRAVS